ncbi:MAG: O-antigen ligase family protein [Candidatus Methylomirabilales bacterium]
MPSRSQETVAGPLPFIALAGFLAVGGALLIAKATPTESLGAGLLIIVLFASFLNTELALHIILLSMLLSPEIVVGAVGGVSIGKPSTKADVLVLRIEDLILTVVTFAWLARTAIFKELGLIRRTPLNAPMFAYIATMVLATLFGLFFGTVKPLRGFFFTLKYFEYFVVFFMTVNFIHDERRLKRLLVTAFGTCAISAMIGIAQIPSGERVGAPFEGKFGEPNTFGGYLVLMLALILAQLLASRALMPGLGWLALVALTTLPLLYTLSRSSWLAAVPMLLTLVLLAHRRLLLVSGLTVLIALAPFVLPKQVVDRYNYTLNEQVDRGDYRIAGSRLDTSTSARLDSWRVALKAWADRPFLGYGVAGFGFIDAQYFRILVEGGLLGFAAFLWLLWTLAQTGLRARAALRGGPLEALPVGYLAGLAAMVTHAIGANTFIIVRIMEPFWFLTGIIVTVLLPPADGPAPPSGRA